MSEPVPRCLFHCPYAITLLSVLYLLFFVTPAFEASFYIFFLTENALIFHISSFNAHFTAPSGSYILAYILLYTSIFDFISIWIKLKPPRVTAFSCSLLYLTQNKRLRATTAQTA